MMELPETLRRKPEEKEPFLESDTENPFVTMETFAEDLRSNELHTQWAEWYGHNPLLFFDEKNMEKLKKMPASVRVAFLAKTTRNLVVTPEIVDEYYKKFPSDLAAVKLLFEENDGWADTSTEHVLFAVSAFSLQRAAATVTDDRRLEQYLETAARRSLAPSFLLEEFEGQYGDSFKEFGEGAAGFLKAMDEAAELNIHGNHFIDPEQIFTPEYEKMPEEQKARFLRKCIAELQFALVFDEAYNSVFTAERVAEDEQASKSRKTLWGGHNVAHSTLFGTYQLISVYSFGQEYFDHEMMRTADRGGDIEEYPFHKLLLTVLHRLQNIEVQKDHNTDTVIDFWNKNRNPIFGNAVADTLSEQDPNRAATKLLELIRRERKNKNPLASILYRLELGRIGISKEGVRYLERMYDLGEYNNPDFFVNRLTPSGEMGIFNEERELIKYFRLGDLTNEEKTIKAAVLDFTYETLFTPQENETPEERERRQSILEEFQKKYFSFYGGRFFQETKLHFNNFSFREQGWYLHFATGADAARTKEALQFVRRFGEDGLRAFLSMEYGDELGDKILDLGQRLPEQAAVAVFRRYVEIVDAADSVERYVQEQFADAAGYDSAVVRRIREDLMRRGKNVLVKFWEETSVDKKVEEEIDASRVLRKLQNTKAEAMLFAASFKELQNNLAAEGKSLDFSAIKDIAFNVEFAPDLARMSEHSSVNDVAEMERIIVENYERYQNPQFSQAILESFRHSLRDDATRFYLLRYKGKVAAFNRFGDEYNEEAKRDRMYFGSFNVDPAFGNGKLGEVMFDKSLTREAAVGVPISADCDPISPIAKKYIESGFVATRLYEFAGVPSFHIVRDAERSRMLTSKTFSREEILKKAGKAAADASVRVHAYGEKNTPDFSLLAEGYVLARYFTANGKTYCVFEKSVEMPKPKRSKVQVQSVGGSYII